MNERLDMTDTSLRLDKRLLKCLSRIAEHRSKPDFDAVFILEKKGLVTITGSSDDLSIEITEKAKPYLMPNV